MPDDNIAYRAFTTSQRVSARRMATGGAWNKNETKWKNRDVAFITGGIVRPELSP